MESSNTENHFLTNGELNIKSEPTETENSSDEFENVEIIPDIVHVNIKTEFDKFKDENDDSSYDPLDSIHNQYTDDTKSLLQVNNSETSPIINIPQENKIPYDKIPQIKDRIPYDKIPQIEDRIPYDKIPQIEDRIPYDKIPHDPDKNPHDIGTPLKPPIKRRRFPKQGDTTFICPHCHKSFPNVTRYDRHIVIHSEIKPYKCEMCPKSFNLKCNLDRHMVIHTGNKSYTCNVCQRVFNQRFNLDRHRLIHTGVKPYECDICNQRFRHESTMITHKQIHFKDKPYKCECGEEFLRKIDYNKHSRVHRVPQIGHK